MLPYIYNFNKPGRITMSPRVDITTHGVDSTHLGALLSGWGS